MNREREIKVMDIAGFGFDKNKLSGEIRKLEIHIPLQELLVAISKTLSLTYTS